MQPNVNTQETLFFALQHGKHRISGSQRCMHISRRLSVMTDRQSVWNSKKQRQLFSIISIAQTLIADSNAAIHGLYVMGISWAAQAILGSQLTCCNSHFSFIKSSRQKLVSRCRCVRGSKNAFFLLTTRSFGAWNQVDGKYMCSVTPMFCCFWATGNTSTPDSTCSDRDNHCHMH